MSASRPPRRASAPAEQVQAIVVGRVDLGETDRILRLLCAEHGRVSAVARGVRGSRRRYAGALDAANKVQVALRPGARDLWALDEAALLDGREGLRRDLLRLTLAGHACEVCASLAREHHPEPRLYGLLDMALLLLDAMTEPPGAAFRLGLEAKALSFAGLAPALVRCPACGLEPEGEMAFHPEGGGAWHAHCAPGGLAVSTAWLEALEHARRTPLRDLVDTALPPGPPWVLADMIEAQLHRPLKARRVLASLEPAAQPSPPRDREEP